MKMSERPQSDKVPPHRLIRYDGSIYQISENGHVAVVQTSPTHREITYSDLSSDDGLKAFYKDFWDRMNACKRIPNGKTNDQWFQSYECIIDGYLYAWSIDNKEQCTSFSKWGEEVDVNN